MNKNISLILVLLINLSLFGQIEKNYLSENTSFSSKEKTVLKTNTDFVLAGEYLFYKLYTINNNKLSNISKIGYVELVGTNKNIVLSHKLKLQNGIGYNEMFIPSKVLTGMYKLIGYTNFSKNNSNESCYVKDIFIINPFTANTQEVKTKLKNSAQVNKKEKIITEIINNPLVSVSTQKNSYSKRELIEIDVQINEKIKEGNYSISIRKLDSIETINTGSRNYIPGKKSEILYIPEMRGELVMGKITNLKNASDTKNKHIGLSLPGKEYAFKVAKSNNEGHFFFNINEQYSSSVALFQVIENNNEDFKIELDSLKYNNYEELTFSDLKINSKLKYNIEQRNIQNQIENAYYEKKQDSILAPLKNDLFYSTLETKYDLDDYSRFKTVRETFIEVIGEAGLRRNSDNSYRFLVYDNDLNDDNISSNIAPLVLVDGILVQNNNDLVYYDSKKIKSIAVVSGQYIYGSKVFEGIIDIKTFLQDFKTSVKGEFFIEKNLKKIEPKKIYYQPDYSDTETLNNRIPDYRRQLLWLPELDFNSTSGTYKAYTSDITGVFEVKLEGFNNLGEFVTASTFIEVN